MVVSKLAVYLIERVRHLHDRQDCTVGRWESLMHSKCRDIYMEGVDSLNYRKIWQNNGTDLLLNSDMISWVISIIVGDFGAYSMYQCITFSKCIGHL